MARNMNFESEEKTLGSFLGLASIGAGAYHGYCDAQGIPVSQDNSNLEWALTFGPTIIRGSIGILDGGIGGLAKVVALDPISDRSMPPLGRIAKQTPLAIRRSVTGSISGGFAGGAVGALQTAVGYGVGYFAGYLAK